MSRLSGLQLVSTSWNPISIADGDEDVKTITIPGAKLGDFCFVSASIDVSDLALTGQVTADDLVTAQLNNNSGGPIDLGSFTLRVKVVPYENL